MKIRTNNKHYYHWGRGVSSDFHMDIPLFIRILEWARETAHDDNSLHLLAERIRYLPDRTLSMVDLPFLLSTEKPPS